jgi:F5/8 type C domain
MANGDSFKLDFTGTVKLTSLTLNNSQNSSGDYAGSYALYGSTDGTSFSSTPFANSSGAAGITTIHFSEQVVKAVKIVVTSARAAWWSISEIQSSCATQ